MTRRILIIVNKSWEAEPLLGVLSSESGRPNPFPDMTKPPTATVTMSGGSSKLIPARAMFTSSAATCEIWCVKDLMDPSKSSASSEEKARVLPSVTAAGSPPDLVVAFGTATIADSSSHNGSVVVGCKAFVHNPYAGSANPQSNWNPADVDKVIEEHDPSFSKQILAKLDHDLRPFVETRLLSPPLNPGYPPILLPSGSSVALSNINVTNPNDYTWADPQAVAAFAQSAGANTVGSVETTHGVIRLSVPSPQFLYVSGIANRLGYFGMEVAPRLYAQNFVASHNAGIALASIIPALM